MTATNEVRANSNPYPSKSHVTSETTAIPITTGTKTADTLSASFCIGALLPCASSTSFIICERAVSAPTFVALNLKEPFMFIVAPITLLPFDFSTGIDSPVIIDSSTLEYPSTTMPSTGIFCPGLTIIMSPASTSSTGTTTSFPFTSTIAVFACSFISFLIASEVLPFAFASKNFPSRINASSNAATSK